MSFFSQTASKSCCCYRRRKAPYEYYCTSPTGMIFLLALLLFSRIPQVASAAAVSAVSAVSVSVAAAADTSTVPGQAPTTPPHLQGQHFRITVLQEDGFLDILEDPNNPGHVASYSGYLVDMIQAIAQETRANFTYTLLPPSGYGSLCVPRLPLPLPSLDENNGTSHDAMAYNATYRTQYNCGASDVNDWPLVTDISTDMYLGMYYVTPARQLLNQFTIPFLPPYSGTLAMFGTATGVPNFETLVEMQQAGLQPAACGPGGSALIDQVTKSFPGLQTKEIFGTEMDILQAFADGTCQIYITDGPIASQFVLRRSQRDECVINGKPIGVIGDPMQFGLSHYAIGIRKDIHIEVERTISYWMNVLMSCNPKDPEGPCPDGNFASMFEGRGGTGDECGYVLYPRPLDELNAMQISFICLGAVVLVLVIYTLWHLYLLRRQKRRYAKRNKIATLQAARERELNEYIAHEVRNPLASAIAALSFVSSKASDPTVIPDDESRLALKSDVDVIDCSLQFVNELLRNMLDLQRSITSELTLNISPTDILRDVFDPVASILFMRGAKVDILLDCPKNLCVNADRMRLKQICMNLAANSSKFVSQGYIRLRAEVITSEGNGTPGGAKKNVHLYIEDSGTGIPLEKQNHLFAKFQESLDVLHQGTGIGLSVCKNLSTLMKADLFLDNTFQSGIPGCPGCQFTLRLNQEPFEFIESNSMSNDGGGGGGPFEMSEEFTTMNGTKELPTTLNVLFVDDDTMLRKMFSRTLKRVAPDWQIQEASNGETALRMVDTERFDVIFIDQYMASVEKQLLGTETVRAMRAKGVDSIICGLSANDAEEQFKNAGANAFMLKPFPCQNEALKRELRMILTNYHPSSSSTNTTVEKNLPVLRTNRRKSIQRLELCLEAAVEERDIERGRHM